MAVGIVGKRTPSDCSGPIRGLRSASCSQLSQPLRPGLRDRPLHRSPPVSISSCDSLSPRYFKCRGKCPSQETFQVSGECAEQVNSGNSKGKCGLCRFFRSAGLCRLGVGGQSREDLMWLLWAFRGFQAPLSFGEVHLVWGWSDRCRDSGTFSYERGGS